ncbi:MAG TPA: DNA-directed RNA polymerase, subunit E'' [Thermoprotei archaeon]|nr:DNA-directed RNA polymerase, subunit E'' [Thermoprotei archaeon]
MPGRKSALFKACRKCKYLVPLQEKVCPNCGSRDFSEDWSGMIIIFTTESYIAQKLELKKTGKYAITVR